MPTIVHIGYHKTGSSFLQALFAAHPRVHYVEREDVRQHLLDVRPLQFDAAALRAWFDEHARTAGGTGRDCVVVSEEELSGNIHTDGNGGFVAKEVADRLHAGAPDAQIVIAIRNQADAIESAYRQYVKMGGTASMRNYVRPEHKRIRRYRFPQFSLEHFEYDALIDYYRQRFGPKRVHVLVYEKLRADQARFLNDFCDRTGLPHPGDELGRAPANVSWAWGCIVLARWTNRFYGADPVNRRVVAGLPPSIWYTPLRKGYARLSQVGWIRAVGSERRFLRGALRAEVEQHFATSNARVASAIGEDLANYGYRC
ncbi:MAG: sulfotransferase [bacterium]|nr:sulfotransferase [bacterium]